jgi:hypothetical protein
VKLLLDHWKTEENVHTDSSLTDSLTHALTHSRSAVELCRWTLASILSSFALHVSTLAVARLRLACSVACMLYTLHYPDTSASSLPLSLPFTSTVSTVASTATPISPIVVVPAHAHADADTHAMDGTWMCLLRPRLQCPICLDVVNEAFLTKCGHTFW